MAAHLTRLAWIKIAKMSSKFMSFRYVLTILFKSSHQRSLCDELALVFMSQDIYQEKLYREHEDSALMQLQREGFEELAIGSIVKLESGSIHNREELTVSIQLGDYKSVISQEECIEFTVHVESSVWWNTGHVIRVPLQGSRDYSKILCGRVTIHGEDGHVLENHFSQSDPCAYVRHLLGVEKVVFNLTPVARKLGLPLEILNQVVARWQSEAVQLKMILQLWQERQGDTEFEDHLVLRIKALLVGLEPEEYKVKERGQLHVLNLRELAVTIRDLHHKDPLIMKYLGRIIKTLCNSVLRDCCIEMATSEMENYATFLVFHKQISEDVNKKYKEMSASTEDSSTSDIFLMIVPQLIQAIKNIFRDERIPQAQSGLRGVADEATLDKIASDVKYAVEVKNFFLLLREVCKILENLCLNNNDNRSTKDEMRGWGRSLSIIIMLQFLQNFFQCSAEAQRLYKRLCVFSESISEILLNPPDFEGSFLCDFHNIALSLLQFAKFDASQLVRFELIIIPTNSSNTQANDVLMYDKSKETFSQQIFIRKESEDELQLEAIAHVHINGHIRSIEARNVRCTKVGTVVGLRLSHKWGSETIDLEDFVIEADPTARGACVPDLEIADLIPTSILAGGKDALAAYHRALKSGSTFDKRVNVLLIGQDRVGKTSLGKSLKGELFNENEPSTDGVQIGPPMKNVDIQPWSNSVLPKNTTVLDHKCAVIISEKLRQDRAKEKPKRQQTSEKLAGEKAKEQAGESIKQVPEKPKEEKSEGISSRKNKEEKVPRNVPKQEKGDSDVGDQSASPDDGKHNEKMQEEINNPSLDDTKLPQQIIPLLEEQLKSEKAIADEGIWPVIWDFAGQAVYRAIHPIFMSPDAVYVLVLDLTKKLFETAHCHVKQPDRNEEKVAGPDSEDTNLDHIMRWMDLVHSLKQSDSLSSSLCKSLPPVILVGTHVDELDGNAPEEKSSMWNKLSPAFSEGFRDHITNNFEIDNTKAGNSNNQEDSQVVDLRQHIIALANELPHIKKKIPLSWLRVEKEIDKKSSQGENYVAKHIFKDQIAKQFCQLNREGDFEELLRFLHARGTIVYHGCTNDEDSLVVMNPQWLVNVLCRIITAAIPNEFRYQNLHRQLRDHGILAEELIDEACKNQKVERIKEQLILIMEKFNLICQWKRNPDGKLHYHVPCMLTTKKDVKSIDNSSVPAPVYLTFNTEYVPSGLFSRLVVLFWTWASEMSSGKKQHQLFANFAKFFVGGVNCIEFVCYKSVIRLRIWAQDKTNPLVNQPSICQDTLSKLQDYLEKLRGECHWLFSMAWDLCAQCDICQGKVDTYGFCHWHKKQGCSHSDCAHYIPLQADLCCEKSSDDFTLLSRESFESWIQAWNAIKKTAKTDIIHDLQKMHIDADKVHRKTNLSEDMIMIASDKGFIISDNQASGNCMFYALSEQLELVKGIKVSHRELRESLVQFLRETPNLPDGTDLFDFVHGYPSWTDYLRSMDKDGTWGDHLILCAAANYYETRIRVISSLDHHIMIDPNNLGLDTNPLVLGHIHEHHYVSLNLPRQETSQVPLRSSDGTQTPFKGLKQTDHCKGSVKPGTPDDDELEYLADDVTVHWEQLGRRLKVKQARLDAFKKQYEDFSEKAYIMLSHWKERNGSAATYQVLHDALCDSLVNRRDLAEKYCYDGS